MRWVTLVIGLSVFACGGQSRSSAPRAASGAGGETAACASGGSSVFGTPAGGGATSSGAGRSSAGGSEPASGAGAGGSGDTGGIGEWTEETESGDSAECAAYKAKSVIPAFCDLEQSSCPTDLTSFLTQAEAEDISQLGAFYALSGCGLTELRVNGGFSGETLVFDSDGKVVGYASFGDTPYGPCRQFQYRRGVHIATCPATRECVIAPDAAETGQLCRCACPDPPPDGGIATVDAQCVDRPSRGWTCAQTLIQWGERIETTGQSGQIRTSCGATVVDIRLDDGLLSCVYDDSRKLVGLELDSLLPTGCPGVSGWRGGATYSSCPDERRCRFGASASDPQLPPCGEYPYL